MGHGTRQRPLIRSTSVTNGRNAEYPTLRDSGYVRCRQCGFICHTDRDENLSDGSRSGEGNYQPDTLLNGAVTAGASTITVDSTSGFTSPSTGSITAFAQYTATETTVTSSGHGLKGGETVVISSTTNYNGTFHVHNVTTTTFTIKKPYVADDATGTWIKPEYIYIYDAGSYATDGDVSSTYTNATGAPMCDRVLYTGLSSTTFTGCVGARAHDDNQMVRGERIAKSGCPFCGSYLWT